MGNSLPDDDAVFHATISADPYRGHPVDVKIGTDGSLTLSDDLGDDMYLSREEALKLAVIMIEYYGIKTS